MTHNICPVCGYTGLKEPAYDNYGSPSYEICRSCNFEFGFDDDSRHFTFEQWREQWIAEGMPWNKGKRSPPPGWDPRKQLLNIGVKM